MYFSLETKSLFAGISAMDLWQRARDFAEEAAKRSQEISKEAAKRSQEFTRDAVRLSQEFVSETAKKSKDLAAEASKKADVLKIEAFKRAEQIKTLAGEIPIPIGSSVAPDPRADLEVFGVTDELREYVKGFTLSSFCDFQIQDEPEKPESLTVLNVRQDLNQWQARHAALILSTAKEISKLRYELCPRYMKERKFWRIYFILVKSYVAVYERQYMEEVSAKASAQALDERLQVNPTPEPASKNDVKQTELDSKASSSKAEDDLDVFLLGDLGSDDDADPGISAVDDDGLDDDFDKIGSSGLESDVDDEQKSAPSNKASGT